MIHRTESAWQTPDWQRALSEAFTDPEALFDYLHLDKSLLPAARAASKQFQMKVPRSYAALIRPGDLSDPLLRQVLPLGEELQPAPGFTTDPVGDLAAQEAPGVLHKYEGRALLVTTAACAINCRFCFRRHYPYAEASAHRDQWRAALDYIARNQDIREVILSGGDPLSLPDRLLASLSGSLEKIPHVKRLRIHTRLPVMLPERLTGELLRWLTGSRLQAVLVFHINHPREVSNAFARQLTQLSGKGVTLLNQTVLLKGVNDEVETLTALSEALFSAGILPYYLHLLDRVQGAAHFEVDIEQAKSLHQALRGKLPGYLLPQLVHEQAGEPSKTPVV